jgi:hypothetical protein
MEWTVKEAAEIELHPNNMITEDGFSLSTLWKPFIHTEGRQEGSLQGQVLTRLSSARRLYKAYLILFLLPVSK